MTLLSNTIFDPNVLGKVTYKAQNSSVTKHLIVQNQNSIVSIDPVFPDENLIHLQSFDPGINKIVFYLSDPVKNKRATSDLDNIPKLLSTKFVPHVRWS